MMSYLKSIVCSMLVCLFVSVCLGEECSPGDTLTQEIKAKQSKETGLMTNPAKMLAKLLINVYQAVFSDLDNQICQFDPSCSEFSKEAFEKYDPVQATLMTSDRLQRCNPFAYQYYPKNTNNYLIDKTEDHKLW